MSYAYQRDLPDGRSIWVQERIYNSIVIIGKTAALDYDSHWCFDTLPQALIAAESWNPATQPEPEGWFRHAMSGRRRPNGDPTKEYIER